jgi:hypothetical protein
MVTSEMTSTNRSGGVDLAASVINIDGDVVRRDKVVRSNLAVNVAAGGNAQINHFTGKPKIKRRAPFKTALPQQDDFTGRAVELSQAEQAIRDHKPVVVYGSDGVGKTALLHKLTASEAAQTLPDGIVSLKGVYAASQATGLNDLAQLWFDQLYEAIPQCAFNLSQARAYILRTRAVVVLDDVSLPSLETLDAWLELGSAGAMLIGWSSRPNNNAIEPVKLRPLPHDEAMRLLATKLKLGDDASYLPLLDRICQWLADMPLAVTTAANIINDQDLPLDQVETTLAAIIVSAHDQLAAGVERSFGLAYATLTPLERQALKMVSAAPALSHDPDQLAQILSGTAQLESVARRTAVTGDQAVAEKVRLHVRRHGATASSNEAPAGGDVKANEARHAIEHLKSLGLLYANSPRLRIAAAFRPLARRDADEAQIMQQLSAHLLRNAAAGNFRERGYCQAELGNALGTLHWAAEHQRWNVVAELGRAIDPYLMLSGLWDAWGSVLDRMAQAARQIGDRAFTAWVLHQSGTRAAGLQQTDEAINLLRQALSIRREIGDYVGARITRHNLDVLTLPPPPGGNGSAPVKPAPSLARKAIKTIVALGLIATLAFGGYTLAQSLPVNSPTVPPAPPEMLSIADALTPAVVAPEEISSPTPIAPDKRSVTMTPMSITSAPVTPQSSTACRPAGKYVADVTIPDGSLLNAGKSFTKIWRVRNSGDCAWSEGVQLVYDRGSQVNGPSIVSVPAIAPGKTIDIRIDLRAPAEPGSYTGRWKLVASDGTVLTPLTVVIKIAPAQSALAAPQLIAPANNAQIDCPANKRVTLAWDDANQRDTAWYEYELSGETTSSTSASAKVPVSCNSQLAWRVRAMDSIGNPGPWSDYAHFVVGPQVFVADTPSPSPKAELPDDKDGPTNIDPYPVEPFPVLYGCKEFVQFKVWVDDPAGIADVEFWYFFEGKSVGSWKSHKAQPVDNHVYQTSIDFNADKEIFQVLGDEGGKLHWYVEAVDNRKNKTNSNEEIVPIEYCK